MHVPSAYGDEPVLMTDANGALTRKQALDWAWRFRDEWDVVWFEEPVSSMDREGLRLLRDHGPPGMDVVAGLAAARSIDLSAHCAPAASAHAFCAVRHLRHLEYFHDHARLERMLFDGTLSPEGGCLAPDPSRPGLGIELKRRDAERYRVY